MIYLKTGFGDIGPIISAPKTGDIPGSIIVDPSVIPNATFCPAGTSKGCLPGEVQVGAADPVTGCFKCAPAPGCAPTTATAVVCGFGKKSVVKGTYTCCESAIPGGTTGLVGLALLGYYLLKR